MCTQTLVGPGDLQHAARAEVRRILEQSKGDPVQQSASLHRRLAELGQLRDGEADALTKLAKLGTAAGDGTADATSAYLESRAVLDGLFASGTASPLALAIASSAVGSYDVQPSSDGAGTVVFAKSNGSWEHRGAAAGAIIGLAFGPEGSLIGGAIGGVVGAIVDDCKK